jgi:hypothetical protein
MKLFDFSKLTGWPASASTWKYQQEQMLQLQMLSLLGGNNYILNGCAVVGGNTGDGWVVINGEVLPFVGGATQANVVVVDTPTNRSFFDATINPYYHDRIATFGASATQYTWANFERNNPANGLLLRMKTAEGLLSGLQTALGITNANLGNKADKSNVLALDNTTPYAPAEQYHPATKDYVDTTQGFKLAFVGFFTFSSTTVTPEKASALTITAARQGTGLYRISHNLGNTNYFINGMGKGVGLLASPRSIVKSNNYFDIAVSDDATANDYDFYFQIFTY